MKTIILSTLIALAFAYTLIDLKTSAVELRVARATQIERAVEGR